MKTKLLFTKKQSYKLRALLVFCLCFNYGWSQELVKNGTCDEHGTGSDTSNTSDNADAWDMTPNSTLNGGITSPYRFDAVNNPDGWRNDDLETYLEVTYDLVNGNTVDEQPGSTSSGRDGTRGVKLYDDADGNPAVSQSTRRLYQRVVGLTIGNDYNFSIDSRSEAAGTPSEVYILNTQITTEAGIDANGYADGSVVMGMDITNDEGAWVTNTMTFTATTTEVVIYVRSLNSIDGATEVFYDNISLQLDATASTKDILASNFNIYPNPAKDFINIKSSSAAISSVKIYDLLGKQVRAEDNLQNSKIDVSDIASGIYLMKINSNLGSLTRKIVIR